MKEKIFFILPSLNDESPIRGMRALTNKLSKNFSIKIFVLKKTKNQILGFDESIEIMHLFKLNWLNKYMFIKKQLKKFKKKGTKNQILISCLFSADLLNSFLTSKGVKTISSIRGNLPKNYEKNFGFLGKFLSLIHFTRLKKISYKISMSKNMADQVSRLTKGKSFVIENFIEEDALIHYRKKNLAENSISFIYLGSLLKAKKPLLLLKSFNKLFLKYQNIDLTFIGDGPLQGKLLSYIKKNNLGHKVKLLGHIKNPYLELSQGDICVLPSLTEGISRSAMEALFLGIPCIMRKVDSNEELIKHDVNGFLFSNDSELLEIMEHAVKNFKNLVLENNFDLLPKNFREEKCSTEYANFIKKVLNE